MNAFDVDYWIDVMCRCSWTLRTLDEKSQHALLYLFHLTDQIASVGRDKRREFWITAERGSIEDFRPYEFNGNHPWEILPSGSVEYSMHLQVMKSPNEFYYGLSGSTFHRSKDTIHSYLAMRKAGLPVRIYDGLKMAARFEETDMIGIVPQGRSTSYVDRIMQYEITDAVHLSDDEKSEQVAAKAIWQPETECKLL